MLSAQVHGQVSRKRVDSLFLTGNQLRNRDIKIPGGNGMDFFNPNSIPIGILKESFDLGDIYIPFIYGDVSSDPHDIFNNDAYVIMRFGKKRDDGFFA